MEFVAARPVLVIIGPSASGKSSVVRELSRRRIIRLHPTWTTRPPRSDEAGQAIDHQFVDDATFDLLTQQGFFVDTAAHFDLPYRYGLPKFELSQQGPVETFMLRAPLVDRMLRLVPACVVYQISDTADRTARRLKARGTGLDDLAARLADNRREEAAGAALAQRIFVNNRGVKELVDQIATALAADIGARNEGEHYELATA
jgi:guanylate kinase